MPGGFQIFLSSSGRDSSWASSFTEELREQGMKVWSDRGIETGSRWEEDLRKRLEDSELVVVVLDKFSANSPWVAFEVGAAVGLGKRVIPIVDAKVPRDRIPALVGGWDSLEKGGPKATARRVAEVVRAANPTAISSSRS